MSIIKSELLLKLKPLFIKYQAVLLILIFGLVLRIIYINEIPPGLTHDEAHDILNAQSFVMTGQQIPGIATGIIGNPTGDYISGIFSELGSYILIPWVTLSGIGWPWIKLPYVISHLGIIVLIYLISKRLFTSPIALISSLLMAVNPWSIHFSRTAYESSFSFFFYFLAIYLLIVFKGWKILWSLIPLGLGSLTYFAPKVQLLPLIIWSALMVKVTRPQTFWKPLLSLIFIPVFLVTLYLLILSRNPAGLRLNEINSQSASYSQTVNIKRTAALDFPLTNIFENKMTEEIRYRISAYLGGLSPNYLFWEGQLGDADALTIPNHGPLYLIDLPLILLGIFFLARRYPKGGLYILGLIGIGLLPNLINLQGTTYGLRCGLIYPLLLTISASGIYYFLLITNKLKGGQILRFLLILGYVFFFVNFLYLYFGRLPVERSNGWFLDQRVLAKYLSLNNPNNPILVVTNEPKQTTYKYLFYADKYQTSDQIKLANISLANQSYYFSNITFSKNCKAIANNTSTVIVDQKADCQNDQYSTPSAMIASIKDAGTIYSIINDQVCNDFTKRRYPLIKSLGQLDIESENKQSFCQTWITNSNQKLPE